VKPSRRILIATHPFGATGRKPLDLLEQTGWELVPNPYRRRLKPGDVVGLLRDVDAVIAGTESYVPETLAHADRLQAICRVGIGLDNVDLAYCREHGIRVTYTPDAPSAGVAELAIANILNLLRRIHESDRSVREGAWNRLMGRLVKEAVIGVIGVGRIGSRVIRLLDPFSPTILANDVDPAVHGKPMPNTTWCDVDELLRKADLVTLHIPMCPANCGFLSRERIAKMRTGSLLINSSRGGVVDEEALTDALLQRHLGGAALDVYQQEPYAGPLRRLDNVVLTAHIGSSARESRFLMELGAAEDCIRVVSGEEPEDDALKAQAGAAGEVAAVDE